MYINNSLSIYRANIYAIKENNKKDLLETETLLTEKKIF